jgi:hypothetical protein
MGAAATDIETYPLFTLAANEWKLSTVSRRNLSTSSASAPAIHKYFQCVCFLTERDDEQASAANKPPQIFATEHANHRRSGRQTGKNQLYAYRLDAGSTHRVSSDPLADYRYPHGEAAPG